MNHLGTVPLQTIRLLVRPYQPEDAPQMFNNFLSDPLVAQHVNWQAHTCLQQTLDFLEMHLAKYPTEKSFYGWAIELDGAVIGSIGAFDVNEALRSCELGYSLGRAYWGRGIITEAASAVLQFLFCQVGFNRVSASYNEENLTSGKVMEKLGMTREGTCRQAALRKDGSFTNLILYGILKKDFSDTKKT